MRIKLTIFFMVFIGLLMTSCQNDNDSITGNKEGNEEKTAVTFELDASNLGYGVFSKLTNQYSPSYDADGFSIYAFRQVVGGSNYVFEKMITLSNPTYDEATKKLTGSDLLPIGVYKFLTVYGLDSQSSLLTLTDMDGETLSDDFTIGYDGDNGLKEIFLPVKSLNVANLKPYTMGVTNATQNEVVKDSLQRAVSRVDIMFIKAKKSVNSQGETVYTETAYPADKDALKGGQANVKKIELRYKGLNNLMSYFGNNLTTTTFDKTITLDLTKDIALIGEHATETSIGKDDYRNYDNISSDDLIYGGAHIFGNYLLPNNNANKTTSLEIYIEPQEGLGRTINVSYDDAHKLPIERNKVTLVKIYILEDDDPINPPINPPTVFDTKVNFEVVIQSVWDKSNEVTGEIN